MLMSPSAIPVTQFGFTLLYPVDISRHASLHMQSCSVLVHALSAYIYVHSPQHGIAIQCKSSRTKFTDATRFWKCACHVLAGSDIMTSTAYCGLLWQKEASDKSSKSEILMFFRLDLACSTSSPSSEQKHSSCWKIFKSKRNDIALKSMYITDTFCSFTRNIILKSCFLLLLSPKFCKFLHIVNDTPGSFS